MTSSIKSGMVWGIDVSEELIKRGYQSKGDVFGKYEVFTIGETTINSLRKFKIIPSRSYGKFGVKRPDQIVVDRRNPEDIRVHVVVEHKQPSEFNTAAKQDKAARQCVREYCTPLCASIGVITDGTSFIWINPQVPGDEAYEPILREDGYSLDAPFWVDTSERAATTAGIVDRCLHEIDATNSQLRPKALKNPSELAERVWQTIWLASGENPDACLATFVEIFVYKYLSDLGVITTSSSGVKITFTDLMEVEKQKCLNFYYDHVRGRIKDLFPSSPSDGTSIINGFILDRNVQEHNYVFRTVLEKFQRFGSLRDIDPEFKSRLYETFLKKSISQKNWGQFFTPRNIVKAVIEMSGIKNLPSGASVHDPACGVGGFLLEPINTTRPHEYSYEDGKLVSQLRYTGYDRDEKTIVLAKANMLIHLNELLSENSTNPMAFASSFNSTFHSQHTSILGSLANQEVGQYDLVMTNPPYVVTGTSTIKSFIKDDASLDEYFYINAAGVEGLFIEMIVRSLKKGGKAFIVVPDGIMNRLSDRKLRDFILNECRIDAIISLPKNTFYTSPKKTYILGITRKQNVTEKQEGMVFCYLATNVGETLDANRFPCDNDLPKMVKEFRIFHAAPDEYSPADPKCKLFPIEAFSSGGHWSVDRWWSREERVHLGVDEGIKLTTLPEFASLLETEIELVKSAKSKLDELGDIAADEFPSVELSLSDLQFFQLRIGKRVLRKEVYGRTGAFPVFSANVKQPFGWMDDLLPGMRFDKPYILWGIDGNFEFAVKEAGERFRPTDHCGALYILDDQIDPYYLYYALIGIREQNSLDRELRANLNNFKNISVRFPVVVDGDGNPMLREGNAGHKIPSLDLERQKQMVAFYRTYDEIKRGICLRREELAGLEMAPLV